VLARLPDVFRCLSAHDVRYVVIGGVRSWIVSFDHLVAMKRAAGRPKDLEDVRVLGRGDAG
jgi:predicted nucleotidyltransferase